jgi:hypothetical protein
MPKSADSSFYDAALNVVKNTAIRQAICAAEPTTFAQIATNRLAEATMTSADYTLAAGDATPTGRKVTIAAKSGLTITGTGTQTANWVVLHDNVGVLIYKTSCGAQSLVNGGTVNIPTWKIDIAGPS